LLIVNADDFGFSRRVTDAAVQAFQAGAISSATSMVWMRDSERAAQVAREQGLPLGLHLNLTVEFGAAAIPAAVRNRQLKLVEHLGRAGQGGLTQSRAAELALSDAVRDQLDRLEETYGELTHVDGHHHVHLRPGVLEAIPARFPVRPPLSTPDAIGRGRSSSSQAVAGRRASRWAFAVQHVHPDLGGTDDAVLALAESDPVEVMTHPADDGELSALVGETWLGLLRAVRTGSYAELP
jgi:predicted glycoside hydrolase/deacetylase ChbG (UPF0249 family)